MLGILSLLAIVALSMLIGRVGTMALTVTGVSRESARFQSRSALTGAGFTTSESEAIVNHPVRRRIVMQLMLVGNIGIVASAAALIRSFASAEGAAQTIPRLAFLVAGLFALVYASQSPWVARRIHGLVTRLAARVTDLDVRDYRGMLQLSGDYAIGELPIEAHGWLAGKDLAAVELPSEGILVLGITRADGDYLGAPMGSTALKVGDTLILYGRSSAFAELEERRGDHAGDRAHQQAVAEQRRVVEEEAAEDAADDRHQRRGPGGDPAVA